MTGSANSPDWIHPKWFRLSDADIGGTDFNRLLLLVLRRLDDAFLQRVDLSKCKTISERISEFTKVWNWLESMEIVGGPLSNCSLTLSGRQSFRDTLDQVPNLAGIFFQTKDGLHGNEARQMMLTLLRQHFHTYVARQKDR